MDNNRLKIVVLDKNPDSLAAFIIVVEKALPGIEVFKASNALQCLNLSRANDPDAILIDISMVEEDGLIVSQSVKKDKVLQLTPMLFITDLETDTSLRIKALATGAEAFLFKPIDETILITQLKVMAKIKERNLLISNNNIVLGTLVGLRTRELKQEIIKRKKSEEKLRKSEEKFKAYIEKAPLGIFVVDGMGRYIEVNEKACQMTGYTKKELLRLSISDYLAPEYVEKGLAGFKKLITNGFNEEEYKVRKKDGFEYWINLSGAKINNNCLMAFCSDITEKNEEVQRIEYLSYHDFLTGVYNRTFYEKEIMRLETKKNLPFSIIISDFNGLKLINDTLGHAVGDKMLVATAKILSEFTRKNDILARVGGDEFSILLPRTSDDEAQIIADRILAACQEYRVDVLDQALPLSLSIGHATRKNISQQFSLITKLAEDRMYRQKLLERNSFHSALLLSLKTFLFERSHETEEHAVRLVTLSRKLGKLMLLTERELNELELLAELHDIGKISIDNAILVKPGKLNEGEWLEMKKHPGIGYRIANASLALQPIAEYILTHHERWDGQGYPQGLSGIKIPLLSRILAVVDSYDAMTNLRSYKKEMSKEEAIEEIKRCSGSQFDPYIASLFLNILETSEIEEYIST